MVLVPTKDLCKQTTRTLNSLLHFLYDKVAVIGLDIGTNAAINAGFRHVIVGTPANAVEFFRAT